MSALLTLSVMIALLPLLGMLAEPAGEPPLGFSYIRFSYPEQRNGDSFRRQLAATEEWCRRNNVRLDTRLTLHDLGVSAFRGKHRSNPDKYALAMFLKAVERGLVPRGSYLIIENLDRLSREEERPALRLWMDILDAGINIVQLVPETVFRHEKSDMMDVMRAVIELSRGHSESAMKSRRNGEAWRAKWEAARAGGKVITGCLPSWVEAEDGVLQLHAERAATVRRIYQLAAGGLGAALIIKALEADGVPPMGPSGRWQRAYINLILADRRAVGEFQPRHRNKRPAGDPLPHYYPPVVTEAEWLAARAGVTSRTNPRPKGRVGERVNVFTGLVKSARDGDDYYMGGRTPAGKYHRVLITRKAADGGGPAHSFPFDVFERALLGLLKEVDLREVIGPDPGENEVAVLAGELAHVEGELAKVQEDLLTNYSATRAKVSDKLEARKGELTQRLAEARRKAPGTLGEQWGECQTLMDLLDKAPSPEVARELRLKLRPLLRRVVEGVRVLVVPRGRDRLAAVQVSFTGDGRRDYLILARPPKANGQGWRVDGLWRAWALADVLALGDLDFRRADHVLRLEQGLTALDLTGLPLRSDTHV
jgi:DNA invertase Pin-like site-specific DNA recombinase